MVIQVRQTRHTGHYLRNKAKLISDLLLRTAAHGCASVGRLAKTYLHQLCVDTRCNLENLPGGTYDKKCDDDEE